jgi:hypothetical protein
MSNILANPLCQRWCRGPRFRQGKNFYATPIPPFRSSLRDHPRFQALLEDYGDDVEY